MVTAKAVPAGVWSLDQLMWLGGIGSSLADLPAGFVGCVGLGHLVEALGKFVGFVGLRHLAFEMPLWNF